MLSAKQGSCEYHFLKSFGMTRLGKIRSYRERGGRTAVRRERESKEREVEDLLVLLRRAKSLENSAGFSKKALTHWNCRTEKGGNS